MPKALVLKNQRDTIGLKTAGRHIQNDCCARHEHLLNVNFELKIPLLLAENKNKRWKVLFHPALKGLKLLYRSGSLSSTDLINNFYQPLAEKKISRGWSRQGAGLGERGVIGNRGVGVVYEKAFRSRFGYMRQVVYITIRVCSHDYKNSMGGVYVWKCATERWIYSMVIPTFYI